MPDSRPRRSRPALRVLDRDRRIRQLAMRDEVASSAMTRSGRARDPPWRADSGDPARAPLGNSPRRSHPWGRHLGDRSEPAGRTVSWPPRWHRRRNVSPRHGRCATRHTPPRSVRSPPPWSRLAWAGVREARCAAASPSVASFCGVYAGSRCQPAPTLGGACCDGDLPALHERARGSMPRHVLQSTLDSVRFVPGQRTSATRLRAFGLGLARRDAVLQSPRTHCRMLHDYCFLQPARLPRP